MTLTLVKRINKLFRECPSVWVCLIFPHTTIWKILAFLAKYHRHDIMSFSGCIKRFMMSACQRKTFCKNYLLSLIALHLFPPASQSTVDWLQSPSVYWNCSYQGHQELSCCLIFFFFKHLGAPLLGHTVASTLQSALAQRLCWAAAMPRWPDLSLTFLSAFLSPLSRLLFCYPSFQCQSAYL